MIKFIYQVQKMNYPLTLPIYTCGSCRSAQDAIWKIQQRFNEYSEQKYVNFVGLKLSDLEEVQKAFPNHVITNTGSEFSTYCEVRPIE